MGRPRRALLSADLIVREALALIDADGVEGFSMPKLAARLGVKSASLYNHVDGRPAIVEGIRVLIVEEMDMSGFADRPWSEALIAWGRSYRTAFARHPNVIGLITTTTVTSPATLHMFETVVDALARGGWPPETIMPVLTSVENFLVGAAFDQAAPDVMIDVAEREDEVPQLAAALRAAGAAKAGRAEVAFERGLAALIDGLSAQLAALADGPA